MKLKSLSAAEEDKLKASEKELLGRKYGTKREKVRVVGERRELRNQVFFV